MMNIIRRAMDVRRLTAELDAAEKKIKQLEADLKRRTGGPSFEQVATRFDASSLLPEIRQRVIDDLSPILRADAVSMLQNAMAQIDRDGSPRPYLYGATALDTCARLHMFRFELTAGGTSFYAGRY